MRPSTSSSRSLMLASGRRLLHKAPWLQPAARLLAAAALVVASVPAGAALPPVAGHLLQPTVAHAAAFVVDSTSDAPDAAPGNGVCATIGASPVCTLRAAIQEANALGGVNTISLGGGVFNLSLIGPGEDAAATGDLDITSDITITGAGPKSTTIDGQGFDRVFDIRPGTSTLNLSGVRVQNGNPGANPGGGFQNAQNLFLDNVEIVGNTAGGVTVGGGGISNTGALAVKNTLFNGNTVGNTSLGGALYINGGTVAVGNSTFYGNQGPAGAIYATGGASVTLLNDTFKANNTISGTQGVVIRSGTSGSFLLGNNILADNTFGGIAGPDCNGTFTTGGGLNIVEDPTGCTLPADTVSVDPGLTNLQAHATAPDYVGIAANSPALNAGTNSICSSAFINSRDQIGSSRPSGFLCDVGAIERTVIPNSNPALLGITLSAGTLTPPYSEGITSYTASVPGGTSSIRVSATRADDNESLVVSVNGSPNFSLANGQPSGPLPLNPGSNTVVVTSYTGDALTQKQRTITITRGAPIPAVSSITTSSGGDTSANLGERVTLTGTDFGTPPRYFRNEDAGPGTYADSGIHLNGTPGFRVPDAAILSWTDTAITFLLPAGVSPADSGPVVVCYQASCSSGAGPALTIPTGGSGPSLVLVPDQAPQGARVAAIGTGFLAGTTYSIMNGTTTLSEVVAAAAPDTGSFIATFVVPNDATMAPGPQVISTTGAAASFTKGSGASTTGSLPADAPTETLSAGSGAAGGPLTVSAANLPPVESTNLYWLPSGTQTHPSTDATGAFSGASSPPVPGGAGTKILNVRTVTTAGAAASANYQVLGVVSAFTVNTASDGVDAIPGDGLCETAVPGECTLRAAIQESNVFAGTQTINLPTGNYTLSIPGPGEDAALTGDLDITSSVNIVGVGATQVFIHGDTVANNDRVFHIRGVGTVVTMSGLTIRDGHAASGDGGGILIDWSASNAPSLTLTNVTVRENVADAGDGGGIWTGGPLTLTNSLVTGNSASSARGGGITNDHGTVMLNTSTVSANTGSEGGGIHSDGPLTLTDSIIDSNTSFSTGGGLWSTPTLNITGGSITGNSAAGNGGGVDVASGTAVISGTTFSGNNGDSGGAINVEAGSLTLTDATVQDNGSCGDGGAISNMGSTTIATSTITENSSCEGGGGGLFNGEGASLSLTDTMVSMNSAGTGGGILNTGDLTLNNTEVRENTAFGAGAIYNSGSGSLSITGSLIDANGAIFGGGLIADPGGVITITGSTISNNLSGVAGGGILASSTTLTVRDSTISGNRLSDSCICGEGAAASGAAFQHIAAAQPRALLAEGDAEGGGVALYGTTASFVNVTFANNTVETGHGGALYAGEVASTVNLAFVTMSGNDAPDAAAIYATVANVHLKASVIVGNGADPLVPNCSGTIISDGYNVADDTSCALMASGDLESDTVPPLDALANYGGATQTSRLPAGHPAINRVAAGSCTDQSGANVTSDQRGTARPQGALCDSGAYEAAVAPPPPSGGGGGGGGGGPVTPPPGPPSGNPPGPGTTAPEGSGPVNPDSETSINVGGGAINDGGVSLVVHSGSVETGVDVGLKTGTDTSGLTANGGTLLNKTVEIEVQDTSTTSAEGGVSSKFTVFSVKKPAEIFINLTKAELGAFKVGDLRGGRVENGTVVNQLPTRVVSESDAIIAIWTDHFSKFTVFSVNSAFPATNGQYETQLTGLGTELSWTNPPGTTQYQLQVIPFNQDGPGINLIRNAETSYRVLEPDFGGIDPNYVMLPGMTYQWRVRTTTSSKAPGDLKETDWGAWDVKLFKTAETTSKTVERVTPQAQEVVESLTPTLQWSNSDKRVFYYEVQVSKDPAFGSSGFLYWELRHGGATTPLNSYTIPGSNPLEADTQYYWRVRPRTQGDAKEQPWSATFIFRTPTS